MKRIFGTAIAAVCLAAATPALAMNICVEGAYPPFSETAADGSLVGFDIDIAHALCEAMGEECELVKVDWDGIIPALLERKCDGIIASMSVTEERKQVVDFSDKYYQTPAIFAAKEDADFTDSAEDLADKTVGVQRGTIHHVYMETHFPETELALYNSQDEAYLDLISGRIDATVADSIAITDGFLKTPQGEGFSQLGGSHVDPEIHGDGPGVAVRQEDTELRDRFSQAIQDIRDSGTYDEIAAKYFDFNIYGD